MAKKMKKKKRGLGGGVGYAFPATATIAAEDVLVVVGFDPLHEPLLASNFRSAYGIDESIDLLGPFTGRLDNAGEIDLVLYHPRCGDHCDHVDRRGLFFHGGHPFRLGRLLFCTD